MKTYMEERYKRTKKNIIKGSIIGLLLFLLLLSVYYSSNFLQDSNKVEIKKHDFVCGNLGKYYPIEDLITVFPSISDVRNEIEQIWRIRITEMRGNETKARQWDDRGVICQVSFEGCSDDMLYCNDMKMLVPVNYTEWEIWYYGS